MMIATTSNNGCRGKDPKQRTKKWAPKVRTGCNTCRIRRVKCDETKPSCQRCTSTGRQCDGYLSFELAIEQRFEQAGPPKSLSIHGSDNYLENRAFDFFRARTTSCVSAYIDDPTWYSTILQAGHAVPPVWHATTALGALHERTLQMQSRGSSETNSCGVPVTFYMCQYSKALKGLQDLLRMPKVPLNLVLLCSLLLIHFEALQGKHESALQIIENALRILHLDDRSGTQTASSTILRAVMRMDDQGFLSKGMNLGKPLLVFDATEVSQTIPSHFANLAQAKDVITSWICCQCHFMLTEDHVYKFKTTGDVPLEVIDRMSSFAASFRRLDAMLRSGSLEHRALSSSLSERRGVAMLRAWTILASIIAATSAYAEAAIYDIYVGDFEAVVDLCAFVIDSGAELSEHSIVPIDEGLLHPLFFAAVQCRDSRLRRQALALIDRLPRESRVLWDIDAILKLACLCVDFEEVEAGVLSPGCEDVFEWKRIHFATSQLLHTENTAPVLSVGLWLRPNGMDGEWSHTLRHIELAQPNPVRWKRYIPARPYGVWWEHTITTARNDYSSTSDHGTSMESTFDTTPYRLEYLERQQQRLQSGCSDNIH